jgi:hypothetical protein
MVNLLDIDFKVLLIIQSENFARHVILLFEVSKGQKHGCIVLHPMSLNCESGSSFIYPQTQRKFKQFYSILARNPSELEYYIVKFAFFSCRISYLIG